MVGRLCAFCVSFARRHVPAVRLDRINSRARFPSFQKWKQKQKNRKTEKPFDGIFIHGRDQQPDFSSDKGTSITCILGPFCLFVPFAWARSFPGKLFCQKAKHILDAKLFAVV